MSRVWILGVFVCLLAACSKNDDINPVIILNTDPSDVHYRGESYTDPGAEAADNYSCDLSTLIEVASFVDTSRYGTYFVIYSVEDDAGNMTEETRNVDIVLPLTDYYNLDYIAYDTCTTGNYFYTGLIQDCNCPTYGVTVGNISNFGLSALFTLPVSGTYNEILTLDTVKAGVHFEGFGTMSPSADQIKWEYTISDSISTDVCTSTWIKD